MVTWLHRYIGSRPHVGLEVSSQWSVVLWCWEVFGVCLLLSVTGCVTKGQAQAQARAAYFQGQHEAEMRNQPQARVPTVTIVGQVSNPAIPWTDDLTLAKAIIAAGYQGKQDPGQIIIVRNGQGIPVDPNTLLSGQDIPLQANDTVLLKQ